MGRLKTTFPDFSLDYQYFCAYSTPSELSEVYPGELDFQAVVILGGAQSANDDWPPLRWEYLLIEEALRRNVPLLGICLGAQMIARALGAAVRRAPQPEIGWFPVHFLDAARTDPLFATLRTETFFHWHAETFDLPRDAQHLARSEACEHQAYRYGDRVWGVQFHPEVTPAMITRWIQEDMGCASPELVHPPAFHPAPRTVTRRAAAAAAGIFASFCDIVNDCMVNA